MRIHAHTCKAADGQNIIHPMRLQQRKIRKARNFEAKNINLKTSYDRAVEGGTQLFDEVEPIFYSLGVGERRLVFSKNSNKR